LAATAARPTTKAQLKGDGPGQIKTDDQPQHRNDARANEAVGVGG
jgi:hypothetical protein